MNPQIKEDWVEALRSGEYEQTQGVLDQDDRQCCLGVLCDILDVPFVMGIEPKGRFRLYGETGVESESGHLPASVLKRTGITPTQVDRLVDLNDKYKATFDEIADYIEATL